MKLSIDHMSLELPISLGSRRHAIVQHLRAELKHFDWPSGQVNNLIVPPLAFSKQETNLSIARQVAEQLYRSAKIQIEQASRLKDEGA